MPQQFGQQQISVMPGFGQQQSNFQNQTIGSLGQMNTIQGQIGMQNQLGCLPPNHIGAQMGSIGLGGQLPVSGGMNLGQINQMNGVQNSGIVGMPGNQMGGMVSKISFNEFNYLGRKFSRDSKTKRKARILINKYFFPRRYRSVKIVQTVDGAEC